MPDLEVAFEERDVYPSLSSEESGPWSLSGTCPVETSTLTGVTTVGSMYLSLGFRRTAFLQQVDQAIKVVALQLLLFSSRRQFLHPNECSTKQKGLIRLTR